MLLCVASLHGNEPAGITALERTLQTLAAGSISMRGDFVGFRGNLRALEAGKRFVDEDLNRVWQPDRVAAILESLRAETAGEDGASLPMVGSTELTEQRELLAAIREAVREVRGQVYVLDLHTTSSESAPFSTLDDTLSNRELALRLPIPVVLGLDEQIDGPMLQYFDRLGWHSVGIEGGLHTADSSIEAHEDAVWLLLTGLGLVQARDVSDLEERRTRLAERARGLPRVVDVRYHHVVAEEDRFRMHPGFENFEPVRRGQKLGVDREGPVRSPKSGRIFLPLYQRQGDDGFFIVRRLNPTWLGVSKFLRKAGADRIATWLPGVRAHPDRDDAVVLSPLARNRAVIGLLHLLGFNAHRESGRLLMVRRVETPNPEPKLDLRL